MPRISIPTIIRAYHHHRLLPLLLKECRTLESARNELRWLRERALQVTQQKCTGERTISGQSIAGWRSLLRKMCQVRSRGMPLQYILGDQPFGDLDIICKKGVLIPRPETETITMHTANLVLKNMQGGQSQILAGDESAPLRILDLCTGTGCISLLLHALLSPHFQRLYILGIDISDVAIGLARRNTEHNIRRGLLSKRALTEVSFQRGTVLGHDHNNAPLVEDLMGDAFRANSPCGVRCDVLISNPPYISPEHFRDGTTSRSVRIFEPELALVPPDEHFPHTEEPTLREDLFYHYIISLSFRLQVKLVVLECGDGPQARRVAALCRRALDRDQLAGELSVGVWSVGGTDAAPHAVIVQQHVKIDV
ncbi:hypothetical protein P175DRAFT_0443083 [Aspergillus ochraceoroseus IBT 24754]|uniref:Methyltransferase domain-containing protein n=1 Tax=Aspergillus ochraceoroseus IBT 24754 TaxID=1392256 RepID=A0A2T5LQW1_9EURO|nr:uncharacterized protein P175DRAFT_0443083 [Aspergillus ochraceoroseus IBT 24754]PTU18668.1 hypothetical protein P175DRAFT_0443083 [Aspergillus ochraceoroseus IBT 24754]